MMSFNTRVISLTSAQPINDKHHEIYSRLIMRDYRQVKKPLSLWAADLRSKMQSHSDCFNHKKAGFEAILSDWFTQACDIFIYGGRFNEAREICYNHIQLMITLSQALNNHDCLCYAFISWVNLARIDRLCKQYHAAMKKIESHGQFHQLNLNQRQSLPNMPSVVLERMRRVYHIEKIKLYFAKHLEHRLIDEFKYEHGYLSGYGAFITDALILSYVKVGLINDALTLASAAQNNHAISDHCFLREQEIKWCYFYQEMDVHKLSALCHAKMSDLQAGNAACGDLLFALHLSRLLFNAKQNDDGLMLLKACLQTAITLNDDVLKSEVLSLLCASGGLADHLLSLEDTMVALYHHTQYPSARAILTKALPSLKHVEINQDSHQLTMLLHDLAIVAASCSGL